MAKLNERSSYLLKHLKNLHPYGMSIYHDLPLCIDGIEKPLGIDMRTFRGLERRGLVRQDAHSLIYITDEGLKELEGNKNG